MRYRFREIEVTRPRAALCFATGETGMGRLVLPHWRPIGFLIWENAGKRKRPRQDLSLWIGGELKTKLAKKEVHYESAVKPSLLPSIARPRANFPFGLRTALQQHAANHPHTLKLLAVLSRLLENLELQYCWCSSKSISILEPSGDFSSSFAIPLNPKGGASYARLRSIRLQAARALEHSSVPIGGLCNGLYE
jgi:hypothetical protein